MPARPTEKDYCSIQTIDKAGRVVIPERFLSRLSWAVDASKQKQVIEVRSVLVDSLSIELEPPTKEDRFKGLAEELFRESDFPFQEDAVTSFRFGPLMA